MSDFDKAEELYCVRVRELLKDKVDADMSDWGAWSLEFMAKSKGIKTWKIFEDTMKEATGKYPHEWAEHFQGEVDKLVQSERESEERRQNFLREKKRNLIP